MSNKDVECTESVEQFILFDSVTRLKKFKRCHHLKLKILTIKGLRTENRGCL